MQKELTMLLDSFQSGHPVQPVVVTEEMVVETVNYLNGSDFASIDDFRANATPNVFLFETRENSFKIETTREIIEKATLRPSDDFNIFILRELEKLTLEAGNSLLKLLEDVPERIIFILTTAAKEKILETIRSRILFFGSDEIRMELPDDLKAQIASFVSEKDRAFLYALYEGKYDRHEYIMILEHLFFCLETAGKLDETMAKRIIDAIGVIHSTNATPRSVADAIILDIG